MERLELEGKRPYSGLEASIHIARYSLARKICEGKRVLDIACGEGYGTHLLKLWGATEVVGVDVSAESISRARSYFGCDGITFLHGDAQELNGVLQDESFDLIVSLETIEHLRRPDEFLEGLRKCLKNDGDIIISCPNDWWYYPEITQHNQYHMRKYRFNEFLDCVVKLLGSPSSIYIGLPLTGFANIKLGMDKSVENIGIKQRDMVNVKELSNVLQVPLEEGTALSDNASYFVCHWGSGDVSSAAILPVPMDVFRNGLYAPNQLEARDSNMTTSNVETNESRKDHGEFEQRLNSNYFHIRTIASRLEIDTLKDRVRYLRDELDRNRAELEKLSHAKRTLQNSFFPPRLMLSILSVIRRLKRKVSHRIKK